MGIISLIPDEEIDAAWRACRNGDSGLKNADCATQHYVAEWFSLERRQTRPDLAVAACCIPIAQGRQNHLALSYLTKMSDDYRR
jgi:hypothetical protein